MDDWRTTREAEHAALGLLRRSRPATRLATHFCDGRVLVGVEWRDSGDVTVLGPAVTEDERRRIRDLHATRSGGRLVVFPGCDRLTGVVTVADLLGTDIDLVAMVGAREPLDPAALVDTQDFVRPTMSSGRVELVVRPAAGGIVVPFEQPNPTSCCADH